MVKVDMSDAYMRVWVRYEDVPRLGFMVPPILFDAEPLVGFHLSLPMGYVDSAQFFCITTKTVADITNASWEAMHRHPPHPLEPAASTQMPTDDENTGGIPTQQLDDYVQWLHSQPAAQHDTHPLHHVNVYMDFCLLSQGDTTTRNAAR
mmetsp:Transcript_18603/g.38903  ORF Transcript_18603/g.38903 Transcript_18603/m.38903 type:complete len:149 (+) Transcript_18603:798-1244(+)